MKTAILGWGSLVWDPRDLRAAADFAPNGPLLPIEFCRVSRDGRLTLVIDETYGAVCTTYSAPSAFRTLDEAIDNLRLREGTHASAIGAVEAASGGTRGATQGHPQAVAAIAAWAASNGYDAAIWMALRSNFDEFDKGGEPFSVMAAVRYLKALEARDGEAFTCALKYIRQAPDEVDTPVRVEVARRWPT